MLDVVLEVPVESVEYGNIGSFNPCCAGCSSGRIEVSEVAKCNTTVSILVVLDVVLEVDFGFTNDPTALMFQSLLCWM